MLVIYLHMSIKVFMGSGELNLIFFLSELQESWVILKDIFVQSELISKLFIVLFCISMSLFLWNRSSEFITYEWLIGCGC